ncbi:FAD-dependent oxidoreductase [Candidatus Woesearchaeota archaeon]|nr:FAD-dependent oxidoreductase [Candidatus Woesearchaeota archaeon]
MYDLIIIGAGPGGLAAAVYAARQKINFCVISKDIGGQTKWSSDVENYLGFHLVSGEQLTQKFEEHIKEYNIEMKEGESVNEIQKTNGTFNIATDKGEYETKTILIVSGKKPRKLNVPGEEEFRGKGVTYCATCDAPLFRDKTVAVVGGGNAALDAALLLEKYCPKIYLITVNEAMQGEKAMIERVNKSEKIEVVAKTSTKTIWGDKFVNNMLVETEGKEREIHVEGVFIEIGSVPSVDFDKITEKNKWNEIVIHSEDYISNQTSVPGIFAAGDCTDVPEKQIIVAAGEAVKAVLGVFKYLGKR